MGYATVYWGPLFSAWKPTFQMMMQCGLNKVQSFLDTKLLDNVIVNKSCDHLGKKEVKIWSKFTQKTTEIMK